MHSNIHTDTDILLEAVFPDKNSLVLYRPIETYIELGKKRSATDFKSRVCVPRGLFWSDGRGEQHNNRADQKHTNQFFGVCPRFGNDGYDEKWQIRIVTTLWADVDDGTPVEAVQRCEDAGLPLPSIVISSGNGAHLYWLLREPYKIDDVDDPPQIKHDWDEWRTRPSKSDGKKVAPDDYYVAADGEMIYLRRNGRRVAGNVPKLSEKAQHIEDILRGIAHKIGGDHTTDLSRLLRLPGTMNRKNSRNGAEPKKCELLKLEESLRFDIGDFAKLAEESPSKIHREKIANIKLPTIRKPTPAKLDTLQSKILQCDFAADRSAADFSLCCYAIQKGFDPETVFSECQNVGKFAERGRDYFDMTWENAKLHTQEKIYESARQEISTNVIVGQRNTVDELTADDTPHWQDSERLPYVRLPGETSTVTESATQLGELIAKRGDHFIRGGAVVRLTDDHDLLDVRPAHIVSTFETVAQLRGDEGPDICSESLAKVIMHSEPFARHLPKIRVVSRCPVLTEVEGGLRVVTGYDAQSQILGSGPEPVDLSLDDAKELLNTLVRDFNFATPSDRSRALAAFITPVLVMGDLLGGRAPIDLGEADQSQSGKGYRNKLLGRVYRSPISVVTQRARGGVGSLEETFNQHVIRGRSFIAIDNVRGSINSPSIESFLTEDLYTARVPYGQNVEVETRRTMLLITSNKAEVTPDLANRSSVVRINKQATGYEYQSFSEGDLLDHVEANQSRFLGAVFAVVRAWHAAGKPRTKEHRHDFRRWAQVLDWIVTRLLDAPPLLDGHRSAQTRMASPSLNWIRDVAIAVQQARKCDQWLRTYQLLEILDDAGVEIPGVLEGQSIDDDAVHKKARQQTGRRLAQCFSKLAEPASIALAEVDGKEILRREIQDDSRNNTKEHWFASIAPNPASIGASIDSSKKVPYSSIASINVEEVCVFHK